MPRLPDIPPEDELTNELVNELFEEARQTLLETTSERWRELFFAVLGAIGERLGDPSAPLMRLGDFEVEGMLGSGSYGMVLKVRDLELERPAALKLCIEQHLEAGGKLMAEARILAKLSHPNIVTVFETGEYDGDLFFVMQYVDGRTLHRYALEKAEVSPHWTELVDIFCAVGEALAAAHDAGIVHGDIKPSNILIEHETNKPYVVDFGLGRLLEAPLEQALVGTLPFMAPEVLREESGDERSDQYSLCMAAWQCLDEGRLPYCSKDREHLLLDISFGAPPFTNAAVPERVLDVLRVGLDADPSQRHADMHAFVRALRLARGPVLVKPRKGPQIIAGIAMVLTASALLYLLRPPAPESDPAELLPRPCASTPWEPSAEVQSICTSIRLHQFEGANGLWSSAHAEHDRSSPAAMLELAKSTLAIAKTFAEEGDEKLAELWGSRAYEDWHSAVLSFGAEAGWDFEESRARFLDAQDVELEVEPWRPSSEPEPSSSSELSSSEAQP